MPKKFPSDNTLIVPAMETLLSGDEKSLWPPEILNDPDLVLQAEMRRRCVRKLNALFRQIPNPTMEISAAVEAKIVRPETVAELYELLTAFFDDDRHHRRLALYLPFELIPAKTWRPGSKSLATSANRFISSYLRCWRELLEESDVRANFVDGNILEPELCPYDGQPLVRKAAHLIPQLVKRGLLSVAEVIALMDNASSEVLKSSIADTMPLLVGMLLLSERECERVLRTHGFSAPATVKMVRNISGKGIGSEWLGKFRDEVAFELRKLEMRSALDQSRGVPKARVAWERQNREDVLTSIYAERIAEMMVAGSFACKNILPFLPPTCANTVRLAAMRGIGMAVDKLAKTDRAKAVEISAAFMADARTALADGVPTIYDELESVLAHWADLGIVTEAHLRQFGIRLPKFDAAFPKNEPLAAKIMGFAETIESLAKSPELSRLLYPVAIFYGSQLKGYARRKADMDVAVFVKPGVPREERENVRQILMQTFLSRKMGGRIVEFWLETRGQELRVRDFPNPDVFLADSTWVHVLLAGVWLGQKEAQRELYAKLLPGFLHSEGKTVEGRDARTLWLCEIEREVLQYRLMHKGYRRFFPVEGGIDAPGAEKLDPQSAFWDSGYRRLATKLFVARIFLPQLRVGEK